MKAFVTGATGLVGNNLVRELLAQGYEVSGLARSAEKARQVFGDLPVRCVVGDMENVDGFAPYLRGADVVFHTAAYFREYFGRGDHWRKLQQINVDGTVKLLEAAERAGVGKVIYVSSSTVIGARADGKPSDESMPPDRYALQNLYAHSKVMAEEAIARFLEAHRLPVVQILPSAILGPGDAAPTRSGQILIDMVDGKLPAVPPGGFSMVDARDVAGALIAAVERGRNGERYIVTGDYHDIGSVLRIASLVRRVPMPRMTLSDGTAMAFARMSEWIASLRGGEPQVTVAAIRVLTARHRVSAAKAERELGFRARPMAETVTDTLRWFEENGYLNGGMTRVAA